MGVSEEVVGLGVEERLEGVEVMEAMEAVILFRMQICLQGLFFFSSFFVVSVVTGVRYGS